MEKKYELTEETKIVNDVVLHRIRALRDFSDVKKGELGGWIEKEKNLSHEGDCWVYHNACVMNDACVSDNARMYDDTHLYDNSCMYDTACMYGNASMYGNAVMRDKARMFGDAYVTGNVIISKSNDVVCFTNVGSGNIDALTVHKAKEGLEVTHNKFIGTAAEFLKAVSEEHGLDSEIGKEYSMLIEVARSKILCQ